MPFALHEYDAAFERFFSQSMWATARASSPLLEQVRFEGTSGPLGSRVRTREGMDVELVPVSTTAELTSELVAVRDGDYEQLYAEMYAGADSMAEQVVKHFIHSIGAVTEGTGNVVNAGGQGLTFELIYEMLEKIELSIDENDDLVLPSLMMSPTQIRKLRALPPLTDAQQQKLDALKERKREEALARRRRRRLS